MEVSIIIPVRDDVKIKQCIESIDEDVEIIVVMNKPTQNVKNIVSKLNVVKVCLGEANLSKAYNAGIAKASFDNILLMDSDCIFENGTIRKLFLGLNNCKLSKGRVIFNRKDFCSNIVAKVREFTTSDFCSAFSPPLMFKKNIIDDIGYYFNPELNWEEDLDFNNRVMEKKLKIHWDKSAIVYHPALSIKADLRSAYNYGIGHGRGIKCGVFPKVVKTPQKKEVKKMQFKYIRKNKGYFAQLYYRIWLRIYEMGIKSVK